MTLAGGKVKTQREIHHGKRQRCGFCGDHRRTLYSYDDNGIYCNVDCHNAVVLSNGQSPAFKRKVTKTFTNDAVPVTPFSVSRLDDQRRKPRKAKSAA